MCDDTKTDSKNHSKLVKMHSNNIFLKTQLKLRESFRKLNILSKWNAETETIALDRTAPTGSFPV